MGVIVELPAAVAELISRGRDMQLAREAEARRLVAEAEAAEAEAMADMLQAVRELVLRDHPALWRHLTLPHTTVAAIQANGWATAMIDLPGCWPIAVNVERRAGGCWQLGRAGEADPYRVGNSERHATLAEAAATARRQWLANQPVPAGLS